MPDSSIIFLKTLEIYGLAKTEWKTT